ncbi:hypothetical protein HK097_004255 [Rhizophlyctis rosea]|uniref:Uncharacterized protein n=1 Tax=Rhizophlyctis rosea TaxID=64517 RepID=A0AAD5SG67_9FUNG|nr:hypothetical protein HK097_004255 [Rhizophlyctis rosea]
MSHSANYFSSIRSRPSKPSPLGPQFAYGTGSTHSANNWFDGTAQSYSPVGPSGYQHGQEPPPPGVSFTEPSQYALATPTLEHWAHPASIAHPGGRQSTARFDSWVWPVDEAPAAQPSRVLGTPAEIAEMRKRLPKAHEDPKAQYTGSLTYSAPPVMHHQPALPSFTNLQPPPAQQQISSLYGNMPPPPVTAQTPHQPTAFETDFLPPAAFIPSSNLPPSKPMTPVTVQHTRRRSPSPSPMPEVNENTQELIDTILAQASIDQENARETIARKDEEIERLRAKVRSLEESSVSNKGKGPAVGDEGVEMDMDGGGKNEEAGTSVSGNTSANNNGKNEGFVHQGVSQLSSDYLARLSYGTMESDELRRWVQILIGRVADLEKLAGLNGETVVEEEVGEDEDVEMDASAESGYGGEGESGVTLLGRYPGYEKKDEQTAPGELGPTLAGSLDKLNDGMVPASPVSAQVSPVISHDSPKSIPDSPMQRLRITSPDRQSQGSDYASSGDEWVRV